MSKILLLAGLLLSGISYAHEGHQHGPSAVQAPKGGVIRSLETMHLELVAKGADVKIYPYDLELKPVEAAKYAVSATVAAPKKKPEAAKITAAADHWVVQHEIKGTHRYTLELSIKQGGHNDKVKWVIETK